MQNNVRDTPQEPQTDLCLYPAHISAATQISKKKMEACLPVTPYVIP